MDDAGGIYYNDLDSLIEQARHRPVESVDAIERIKELVGKLFDTFFGLPFSATTTTISSREEETNPQTSDPVFQLLGRYRDLTKALDEYFKNQMEQK